MILFAVRLLTLSFAGKVAKFLGYLTGGIVVLVLIGTPMLGILAQPLAPFWLSGQRTISVGEPAFPIIVPPIIIPPVIAPGGVSDVQRYLLAIGAGFTASEAITATAISIAEDGSGNPSALSGANFDGSRDLGLWQINSGWWARFGGQAALTNPVTNAIAARYIYGAQGWCAWSTFEANCGPGHNSAYRAFMERARVAAQAGG